MTTASGLAGMDISFLLEQLAPAFGDRLTLNEAIRAHHGRGQDQQPARLPDAVVFAENAEEIALLLRLCNDRRVPVTAFGAGTSLEQQVTPVRGGISLDLSRMNRILEVSAADMDCLVEPGVTRESLNSHLRDTGLFMPIDPGAQCTIGGMCATRASGTNAVRYGTIRENVLALEAILADGRMIRTGSRARKAANGYDLTHLLIGSEGTLGIITRIRLRLHGIPETSSAAICGFPTLADAVAVVTEALQCGIPIARVELMDAVQAAASAAFAKLPLPARPILLFEFSGTPASVAEQSALVRELAAAHGGENFEAANSPEERARLWRVRHDAYWAAMAIRQGMNAIPTDVCVPISRLADVIDAIGEDIEASSLTCPITGHVGDGNFHVLILFDPEEADAHRRATLLDQQIVGHALAAGGTCSGEHGIGLGKSPYLLAEHGQEAIDVMATIKAALDPNNILNPGKITDGLPL